MATIILGERFNEQLRLIYHFAFSKILSEIGAVFDSPNGILKKTIEKNISNEGGAALEENIESLPIQLRRYSEKPRENDANDFRKSSFLKRFFSMKSNRKSKLG